MLTCFVTIKKLTNSTTFKAASPVASTTKKRSLTSVEILSLSSSSMCLSPRNRFLTICSRKYSTCKRENRQRIRAKWVQ